ncbi:lipid-A-disaccharide synthase [Marinicella sp. W31]|uniref:lipid-A-disaccharide synthase n=1 Tax=Marinicella sp. W31 TaxID=3023713 RepID=UPI0037570DF5
MSTQPLKVAIVTGEASGDLLAAELLISLKELGCAYEAIAVGGERVKQAGARIIQDNDAFAVMGLVEVLKDLPRLLRLKKKIVQDILAFQPDVFIGVDAPDLNFPIAKELKRHGITTVHYVSPSVWAWRPKRVYKMAGFLDGVLTLFPFEPPLYEKAQLKAVFCGHPAANQLPLQIDKQAAKAALGLDPEKPVLAVLPGSRNREIKHMTPIFAQAIKRLEQSLQNWQVVTANVTDKKCQAVLQVFADADVDCQRTDSALALLKAADATLLASGTVALEAMLCKTPMVVSYKISPLTSFIVKSLRMMQLPYYSLPNVIHGDFLVPELMQKQANAEEISQALVALIETDSDALIKRFTELHEQIQAPQEHMAASAILELLRVTC